MTQREAEDRMLALVRQADLHGFETQRPVQGHTVDFLWRGQRVVVEVDGYRYHSDRRRFESDRRRDADLQAHGYAVLRVTWRQLRREPLFRRPSRRAARARRGLASRRAARRAPDQAARQWPEVVTGGGAGQRHPRGWKGRAGAAGGHPKPGLRAPMRHRGAVRGSASHWAPWRAHLRHEDNRQAIVTR